MFRVGINRTGDNSFTGQIGLVQIWNDSAQDAAALFAAGPGIVPEPSRAAFLALGLGAMMLRRRR
ncbi:MAG: PEP-CTERM sorting domain-containing protein [Verrucomicrobiales bacterium]